jgi:hypothetical protein
MSTELIESEIDELGEDGWNLVADLSRAPLGTRARPFYSMVQDRSDGKFGPYYANEWDLRRMRAVCRLVESQSSVAESAFETLAGYVVGTGYTFKAKARPNAPEGSQHLAAAVQRFLDQFVDANGIKGGKDDEVHRFSRIDGERPTAVYPAADGLPRLRVFDPNQITQPASTKPIERHYDFDARDRWEFGVHTRVDEYGRHDSSQVLGYHVLHDEAGYDWEYIPRERMELFRRNVPAEAKRGVSDLFKPVADLQREGKLSRNAAEGMAILSAIAYIKENPQGAAAQPGAPGGSDSITRVRPRQDGGGRSVQVQRFHPGSIVHLFGGAKYQPSPLSSMNTGALRDVSNAVLMRVGSRWSMPGYMLTGDTNTALYSAVLVMGSPFVNARVRDQEWFKARWLRLVWKALKCASALDWFGAPLEHVERFIEIEAVLPPISLESGEARANRQRSEIEAGTLSQQTAIEEAGRDPKIELPRIEQERAKQQPANPLAGMLGESLQENCGTGDGGFKSGNDCQGKGGGGHRAIVSKKADEIRDVLASKGSPKEKAAAIKKHAEELRGELANDFAQKLSGIEAAGLSPKLKEKLPEITKRGAERLAKAASRETYDKSIEALRYGGTDLLEKEPDFLKPQVMRSDVEDAFDGLLSSVHEQAYMRGGDDYNAAKAAADKVRDELAGKLADALGITESMEEIRSPAIFSEVAQRVTDRIFEGYP